MGYKDLHDDPFDENTILKLELFEDYAQAWLPTFIMLGSFKELHIFDFFAGTGYDKIGVPGSPIRFLKKILEQKGHLFQKEVKIVVHLNSFEPNKKQQAKFDMLVAACNKFLEENPSLEHLVEVHYYNKDFDILFPQLLPLIQANPSLVLIDQNGIKFLNDAFFLELIRTKMVDFLFFSSSSYVWRFGEQQEFREHLEIDLEVARQQGYHNIHQVITDALRERIPEESKMKLYPFTIKKGANIYGIIFGASHIRAVDKFLALAWKKNDINGMANFDIDDDSEKAQLDMFVGKKATKLEKFEALLEEEIMKGNLSSNYSVLDFVYAHAHIPSHAAKVVRRMKKEGKISYHGKSPLITYENVHKKKHKIVYKLM